MNLQQAVSKHLESFAFFLNGNTVYVKNQDDLRFLKGKLKSEGLPGVQVLYHDGKRTFDEHQLKSVIVAGNSGDKSLVFGTLEALHARHTFTQLYLIDYPSYGRTVDSAAAEWAKQRSIATRIFPVSWRLGQNAAAIEFGKRFKKGARLRPNMVVAFTNKEVTAQVKKAQKAGVTVVFA